MSRERHCGLRKGRALILWPLEDSPWTLLRLQRLRPRLLKLLLRQCLNPSRSRPVMGQESLRCTGQWQKGHHKKGACLVKCFLWKGSRVGDNPPHSSSSLALDWQAPLQEDPHCWFTGARDSDWSAGYYLDIATYLQISFKGYKNFSVNCGNPYVGLCYGNHEAGSHMSTSPQQSQNLEAGKCSLHHARRLF